MMRQFDNHYFKNVIYMLNTTDNKVQLNNILRLIIILTDKSKMSGKIELYPTAKKGVLNLSKNLRNVELKLLVVYLQYKTNFNNFLRFF